MGKVYCQICRKRCKGDVLKIHDKFIHKSCFLCCCCKTSLEKGGFFMKDEKYYCKKDYLDKFGVKCQVCNETAEGEVIVIFATTFHPNCFKCRNCLNVFQRGDKVTLCNDQYLCHKCVLRQNNIQKTEPETIQKKPDETLTMKKSNNAEDPDTMTTSLISTIISDSSENESATPEKRNLIDQSIINSSKISKIESTYSKNVVNDFNSDTECLSIRTEPEMSKYNPPTGDGAIRNCKYGGSTSSLRPNQYPMPFGKFYNFSYLKLEETLKSQVHPNALFKTSRSNISTSSSNIHHYHKIDNFSYRSQPNVTRSKKLARSHNLIQAINGKKTFPIDQQVKDSDKQSDNRKDVPGVIKPALINSSSSSLVPIVLASSMVDVATNDPTLNGEPQSRSESSRYYPMKTARPPNVLDPISASRAPSASYEPLSRPRYEMHGFTSPSRHLIPQEISDMFPSPNIKENSNKDEINTSIIRHQSQLDIKPTYKSKQIVSRSQVICSKPQDQDYISVQSFLRSFSREKLSDDRKPKIYSYEELKISNSKFPKGVDRSRLEIYLSEEEFERLFTLSRFAFNRLPEWKRNDLKRRMDLF